MCSNPQDAAPSPSRTSLLCRICGRPVPVETAKTDSEGKPIHEECYALKVKFKEASRDSRAPDGHSHSTRSWKEIAAEVTREQNSKKIGELVAELNQALDEQRLDGTPKPNPDAKKID